MVALILILIKRILGIALLRWRTFER